MSVFQAVLFVIAKKWGKNKYPSAAEQICEMWYTHTVIYYLAIKKEWDTSTGYNTIWTNTGNVLRKRIQIQNAIYCMVLST